MSYELPKLENESIDTIENRINSFEDDEYINYKGNNINKDNFYEVKGNIKYSEVSVVADNILSLLNDNNLDDAKKLYDSLTDTDKSFAFNIIWNKDPINALQFSSALGENLSSKSLKSLNKKIKTIKELTDKNVEVSEEVGRAL